MREPPVVARDGSLFDPNKEQERVRIRKTLHRIDEVSFEVSGVDAPFLNALRRVLLAEVPTMAIEYVTVNENSTVMNDEFLAHRLGLLPVLADPRRFEFRRESDEPSAQNTICFRLRVPPVNRKAHPEWNLSDGAVFAGDDAVPSIPVYSDDIIWEQLQTRVGESCLSSTEGASPHRSSSDAQQQAEATDGLASAADSTAAVEPVQVQRGILLTKMLRGQRLDIRMEAVKGLGHDHAKWSPVATAYYKMVPRVRLKGELKGELAETIRGACAVHVFDIEESAGTLKVEDESRCTLCGECVRILEDKPQLLDSERPDNYSKFMQPMETDLRKVYENDFVSVCQQTDRFVFFIESVGQYRADVLFGEALAIFHSKCTKILEALQNE